MSTIAATWIGTNGDWSTAGNWQEGNPNYPPPPQYLNYVPGSNNDVNIDNNLSSGGTTATETVTYNTTDTVNSLTSDPGVVLQINGGALTSLTGGSVDTINLTSTATFTIAAGHTQFAGNGSFAGTLAGAGIFEFIGGTFSLNAGFTANVTIFELGVTSNGFGSTTTLNTDLTLTDTFKIDDYSGNQATLKLNSHTLTLSGTNVFDGNFVGPGTVKVTSSADEITGYGGAAVYGGATLEVVGGAIIRQAGNGFLGDTSTSTTGTLQIDANGTYDIVQSNVANNVVQTTTLGSTNGSLAIISNAGLFEVTHAGATPTIGSVNAAFTNLGTGTISVSAGDSLTIAGATEMLGGTISGAGTLNLSYGTATLTSTAITVATIYTNGGNGGMTLALGNDITYNNIFLFKGQFDNISLAGHTLTLGGTASLSTGVILGDSNGVGTLKVTGAAELAASIGYNGGAATFEDAGAVTQDGNVTLHGTVKVDAGALYTMAGGIHLSVVDTTTTKITNGGVLRASSSSSGTTDEIDGNFTNTGTVTIDSGATLLLAGGTETLGAVVGAGTLDLGYANNATFNSTNVTVANIYIAGNNGGGTTTLGTDLSYGGNFTFINYFGTLALNGHTLTLGGTTAALSGGTITGSSSGVGTIKITGTGELAAAVGSGAASATIEDANTILQDGGVGLDGLIKIDSGALYTMAAVSITDNNGNSGVGSTVTNAGTLRASSTTSGHTDEIDGTFTNTGLVTIDTGTTFVLAAGIETLGAVGGAGTLDLGFGNNATFNSSNVTVANIYIAGNNGGGTTTLSTDLSYGGAFTFINYFGTLALNGHTLTLSGVTEALSGGTITGSSSGVGTIKITGSGELAAAVGSGASSVMIEDANAILQDGNVGLDGLIKIDSGALYTMTAVSITNNNGNGGIGSTVTNAGTLRASSTTSGHTDEIDGAFTNTGLVTVDTGTTLLLSAGTEKIGAITGAGTLDLGYANSATFTSSNVTVASIYISGGNGGGTTTLGTDLSYGGSFTFANGFGTLALNGHTLTLTGISALSAGGVAGAGTVRVLGTTEVAAGFGAGAVLALDAGGHVQLDSTQNSGALLFGPGLGSITLASGVTIGETISGFAAGDTIDLSGVAYKASYQPVTTTTSTGVTLQIVDTANSNGVVATFNLAGNFGSGHFTVKSDGASGTPGTLIGFAATATTPITGPTAGHTVDLTTTPFASTDEVVFTPSSSSAGALLIVDTAHGDAIVGSFTLSGSYANGVFTLASDGASGTNLGFVASPPLGLATGNVETSAIPGGAPIAILDQANSDGSLNRIETVSNLGSGTYKFHYANGSFFTGKSFAAFDNVENASGALQSQTLYNAAGMVTQQTVYNANGTLYEGDTVTILANGNMDYHYSGGTFFNGKSFSSFDNILSSAGVLLSQTLYNSSGVPTQQTQFNGDGSIYQQGTVTKLSNGNLDYHYATGTYLTGKTFTTFDNVTTAAGVLLTQTQYNSSGKTLATIQYNADGSVYLQDTITTLSNGNIDYHYQGGSFFNYKAFASFDNITNSSGVLLTQTQYDASGKTIQETQYNANGSIYLQDTVSTLANGNVDTHFAGGSFFTGKSFVAFDNVSNASGLLLTQALLDATGATIQQTQFNSNGTVYLQDAVSTPASGEVLYTFNAGSALSGKPYSSFTNLATPGGTLLEQELFNTDGSHTFTVPGSGLTLPAAKNDTFNVTGSAETVRFGATGFGADVFKGYSAGDIFSFSTAIFANYTALSQHVSGTTSAVITDSAGDTLTLNGVAKTSVSANMFAFA